ncbi:uncharacterized protein M421DRAFT_376490 [Didymella exigua CBS 183.55]|uniref:Zn(2)-C6 fungal-type domain-containing protein n=1 Tax=Didymella exigua CBS 183.55 TaxID=1150837 RepID=A0A6A5RRY7_9PLEO|nr:uncharacterized protein M421DRAFT_376490 [Didymella exigua CBS 183.55]KAF1930542.1 hypothetical protein M421DRAFT_376490 [Didymella exigua CBS 183.55]
MTSPPLIKEEQTSSDESQIQQQSKTRRPKTRASVACTSCRDRRIRCVVPSGKKRCIQCERSGTPCVIRDDDERRRPISRAYVYSLVERIALLESVLEEQGLIVPPASHPPETRHRTCRSKDTSSLDHTSLSSSTPQESSVSESHTASSPYSSDGQLKDEHFVTTSRERSSIHLETNFANEKMNQHVRHDSFIVPGDIGLEPTMQNPIDTVTGLNEPCDLSLFAMLPPPDPTCLWPTAQSHTGGQTMAHSILQCTRIHNCTYSAWSDRALDFQSYGHYSVEGGSSYHNRQHPGISPRVGSTTNLDFMPLSASS